MNILCEIFRYFFPNASIFVSAPARNVKQKTMRCRAFFSIQFIVSKMKRMIHKRFFLFFQNYCSLKQFFELIHVSVHKVNDKNKT